MNMTMSDLINVRETCVYQPSESSPENKTLMQQRAEITAFCGGWQKIRNSIEQFTVDRFQQNAQKGRKVFQEQRELLRLQSDSRILREVGM
jgi:hypothetical protein